MNILLTGGAGFIGSSLAKKLVSQHRVVIIDDLNDYYDIQLKRDRLEEIKKAGNFIFEKIDICQSNALEKVFAKYDFSLIYHLAARAGVRTSIKEPVRYAETNIIGTLNILEAMKKYQVKNLVFASSSSVYSGNEKIPYSEQDIVDRPLSQYAASKKSAEVLIYTYHKLYEIKAKLLRYFTVYGPWGRPDMAYFKFSDKIIKGEKIDVYNYGKMKRDFTYIDDIVEGTLKAAEFAAEYEVFNLGHNQPVELSYFISLLEKGLGVTAKKEYLPLQVGEPVETYANINKAQKLLGFTPRVSIEKGIDSFITWYKRYKKI